MIPKSERRTINSFGQAFWSGGIISDTYYLFVGVGDGREVVVLQEIYGAGRIAQLLITNQLLLLSLGNAIWN